MTAGQITVMCPQNGHRVAIYDGGLVWFVEDVRGQTRRGIRGDGKLTGRSAAGTIVMLPNDATPHVHISYDRGETWIIGDGYHTLEVLEQVVLPLCPKCRHWFKLRAVIDAAQWAARHDLAKITLRSDARFVPRQPVTLSDN